MDEGQALAAHHRRRVLASMMISLALVVSAVASLNIALPDIAADIGASQTELQWIVDSYAVVFAGLLLIAGAVGDKYGRKHTLVWGLVVFGAAYGLGALADEPWMLIAARAAAGVGSALVMPSTLSIITTTFPPEQRSKAVGTWAGVASGGAVLGLLLSGFLVEVSTWQWVFAANAIWAALALAIVLRFVPHSRDAHQPPLDGVGAVLSSVGLAAMIFATIEGPERGWTSTIVGGSYALGALLLVGFVLWELRRKHPLLDPRLFTLRGFRTGTLSMTLQFFALFGFIFAVLQYLQLGLDYSPFVAALALIPIGVFTGFFSRIVAPRLITRFGHRVVDASGLLVLAGGFAALATLQANSSYWHILAALAPLAVGIGLATTPATASIVEALPPEKQGVASAVNDAAREVGGAVGIAVLGSLLNNGYRSDMDAVVADVPPQGAEFAEQARDSLSFVKAAADGDLPQEAVDAMAANGVDPTMVQEIARGLLPTAQESFVNGMSTAMTVAAVVMVVGAVLVFGRGRRSDHNEDAVGDRPTEVPVH